MPEESTDAEVSETGIRSRVIESALELLAAGQNDLSAEFREELRGLLGEAKPPRADAFVTLFEKHEGEHA